MIELDAYTVGRTLGLSSAYDTLTVRADLQQPYRDRLPSYWKLSASAGDADPLFVKVQHPDGPAGLAMHRTARHVALQMGMHLLGAPIPKPTARPNGPYFSTYPAPHRGNRPPHVDPDLALIITAYRDHGLLRPPRVDDANEVRRVLGAVGAGPAFMERATYGAGPWRTSPANSLAYWRHTCEALNALPTGLPKASDRLAAAAPDLVLALSFVPTDPERGWRLAHIDMIGDGEPELRNVMVAPDGTALLIDLEDVSLSPDPLDDLRAVAEWAAEGGTLSEDEAMASLQDAYRDRLGELRTPRLPGKHSDKSRALSAELMGRVEDLQWLVRRALLPDDMQGPSMRQLDHAIRDTAGLAASYHHLIGAPQWPAALSERGTVALPHTVRPPLQDGVSPTPAVRPARRPRRPGDRAQPASPPDSGTRVS